MKDRVTGPGAASGWAPKTSGAGAAEEVVTVAGALSTTAASAAAVWVGWSRDTVALSELLPFATLRLKVVAGPL